MMGGIIRVLYQCLLFLTGAPVAVGMNIDIASIDMVSEVNMVGAPFSIIILLRCQRSLAWHGWNTSEVG